MTTYQKSYHSEFSTKQLFDLVADIEKYPEFLPWCSAARILSRSDNILVAELVIYFAPLSQKYTSRVSLFPPENSDMDDCSIEVDLVEGPFEYLRNRWKFSSEESNKAKTIVDFTLDFKFNSMVMQKLMGSMFEQAFKKMLDAFQDRAAKIYY